MGDSEHNAHGSATETSGKRHSRYDSSIDQPNTSVSVNSQGEEVPTRKIWSFSRFWRTLILGRPPIALLMIAFILVFGVGIAFLSWGLTYQAATKSAHALGGSLQREMLKRLVGDAIFRLRSAEEGTNEFTRGFRKAGFYDITIEAGRKELIQRAQAALVPRRGLFQSLYITTVDGYMNGAWVGYDPDYPESISYQQWWMFGNVIEGFDDYRFDVVVVEEDGTFIEYKSTYEGFDQSEMPWMKVLEDGADGKGWISAFPQGDEGWISYSEVAVDSSDVITCVVGSDMSLGFLDEMLQDASKDIPYANLLYAIEVHEDDEDDIFLAASEKSPTGSRLLKFTNAKGRPEWRTMSTEEVGDTDPKFNTVLQYLKSGSDGGGLKKFLTRHPAQSFSGEIEIAGAKFTMQIGEVRRKDLYWAVIVLVSEDDVLLPLTNSNKKAIGIIAAVVAAACGIATVSSFLLARALFKITRDLKLLANFKFQDVLQRDIDKESGVRQPVYSRIQELWQIQRAFHVMVTNFAKAVAQNRSFGASVSSRRG
ncbi:hypothetical protein HDU85_002960 [Gaertneriomyces sp. JEL0708]|nr:hypothetical protein HDU85_002960 [Gaertneriomyces sp. JEL0708]